MKYYRKPFRPTTGKPIAYRPNEKKWLEKNSPHFFAEMWGKTNDTDLGELPEKEWNALFNK